MPSKLIPNYGGIPQEKNKVEYSTKYNAVI